jgi:hypothetical protein
MHKEGVLATYELCSEHIHVVLQQAAECFDRSEHSRRLWNNRPAAAPASICCLRFHSAALFTADFSSGTIGNATPE